MKLEVTYIGEYGVHRVPDFEGEEYAFERGVPLAIPEDLAEQLLDRPEEFVLGDEVPEPEVEAAEDAPETEGDFDEGEDSEGVNDESPYGEG